MRKTIFLFGSAETGPLCQPLYIHSVQQLLDQLGHPPQQSEGIYHAIQALLFRQEVIYFRVTEEGFSTAEYIAGIKWLKMSAPKSSLSAIYIPGIGDEEIIQEMTSICHLHRCLLVISEKDLYDYLTSKLH